MEKRLFFVIVSVVLLLVTLTSVTTVTAVQFWHKDTNTKGNWIEKIGNIWVQYYGRDGYILSAFDSQEHNNEEWQQSYDRKSLLPYITNYTVSGTGGASPLSPGTAGVNSVAAPTSDERALIDPDILGDPDVLDKRRNTHWFTTPYDDPDTVLTVELEFSEAAADRLFYLSLYFLEVDQNRKLNVTVSDGELLGAPHSWSVVIEPEEAKIGVYLVFTIYGPTNLEIEIIPESVGDSYPSPIISGIFLDSMRVPNHVIPEVPLGTLSVLITCFASLIILKKIKGRPSSK
jgi:hypothetical protein